MKANPLAPIIHLVRRTNELRQYHSPDGGSRSLTITL